MNIYVSHAGSYDYKSELYEPIKKSELYGAHHFFLPHESQNADATSAKDALKRTDLLVAEVSLPSTGQGIELGLAHAAAVPIVCFYKAGAQPSNSLRFITDEIIEYSDMADLLLKLKQRLSK